MEDWLDGGLPSCCSCVWDQHGQSHHADKAQVCRNMVHGCSCAVSALSRVQTVRHSAHMQPNITCHQVCAHTLLWCP
jgi:translation initiation factor 2 gamma subunit (eIF-2gamma)